MRRKKVKQLLLLLPGKSSRTGNQLAFQSRINLARFYDADHKAKRTNLLQQATGNRGWNCDVAHDHVASFLLFHGCGMRMMNWPARGSTQTG